MDAGREGPGIVNDLIKDLLLLAARRDERARAAIRAVGQVRRFVRKSRKIAREAEKLSGRKRTRGRK